MTDDIVTLYDRAAREMRPEFKRELRNLLVAEQIERTAVAPDANTPLLVMTEQEPGSPSEGRMWHRLLLIAAIGVAVVGASVVLQHDDAEETQSTSVPTSSCLEEATELGVVQTSIIDVRVLLMPDGRTFCLVDDARSTPLGATGGTDLLVNDGIADVPPETPTVVDQGVVSQAAYWYLIAIPEGTPVARVDIAGVEPESFPTRIGRRLLVVDTDIDSGVETVTKELNLYSSAGVVLATVQVTIEEETP